MSSYDIVVVGSGIVGLTFANIMAQNSALKIAVVSADEPLSRLDNGRVCALNHASLNLLKKLQLNTDGYSYYDKVFVWEEGGIGSLAFDASEFGYSDLGAIVNNLALEVALWQKIKTHDNVRLFCGDPAESLSQAQNYELSFASGHKISARMLVGADGAHSWTKRALNIKSSVESYEQDAIVATLWTSEEHKRTAWQKFVATGTVAILPLLEPNTSSLVWSCRTDVAAELMELTDAQFAEKLSSTCDYKFGEIKVTSRRVSFPLKAMQADNYISKNAAIIGDAAHVVHPLAGQGVNYGIRDAKVLADELLDACDLPAALANYEKILRGQNGVDLWLLGQIKKAFTSDLKLAAGLLGFGLRVINSSKLMKKHLLAKALGFSKY